MSSNNSLTEHEVAEMYAAMEQSCLGVVVVDLKVNVCKPHYFCEYVANLFESVFDNIKSHSVIMNYYIERTVFEMDREKMKPFISCEYIRDQLKKVQGCRNDINIVYRVERGGELFYRKIKYVAMDPDCRYAVEIFLDCDEEIKKETAYKEWLEKIRDENVTLESMESKLVSGYNMELVPHIQACLEYLDLVKDIPTDSSQQEDYRKRMKKRLEECLVVLENHTSQTGAEDVDAALVEELIEKMNGHRVLLADVDQTETERLTFALGHYGVQVTTSKSSADTMNLLRQVGPHYYAYVILDKDLPDIDGFRTTQMIRGHKNEELAAVPVIVIAERCQDGERKAKVCGADAFLKKPFNTYQLLQTFGEIEDAKAEKKE